MTTTQRFELLTTGPRCHYAKDTKTITLYGPMPSKREAQAMVDRKNDPNYYER